AVVATAAPIHGATTSAVGYVLVLRDVTDWERMEAEVRRTQKLESLGVLAGCIAHDFNNLLMAVMGNIEIAAIRAADRPQAGERLSAAVAACERARDLTQQLLTFARGGAPTRTAANLAQVIRETAEFIGRGSAIAVELALGPDLWAVEADPGQISQVLQNLLINALQASNRRGRVLIEASNVAADERHAKPPQPDRFVPLSVRDHGEGIPADTMDKIFDPYFTTRPGGTGLGLSTVYSIVQKHGGRVEVSSSPSDGTRFDVYLPATDAAPASSPSPNAVEVLEGGRVLLMDDDALVRETAAEVFQYLGYEVEETADGREALDCYEDACAAGTPFDFVVLDLTVPGGMGGEETVAQLKERHPDAVVVASSGYTAGGAMAEHRARGFDHALAKPYRLETSRRSSPPWRPRGPPAASSRRRPR
ncbi:MAG: response regulator, partial [Deltaproteobacteria bacterium]|nr:response regulator [Deltaproteobacteria bacterium]